MACGFESHFFLKVSDKVIRADCATCAESILAIVGVNHNKPTQLIRALSQWAVVS